MALSTSCPQSVEFSPEQKKIDFHSTPEKEVHPQKHTHSFKTLSSQLSKDAPDSDCLD